MSEQVTCPTCGGPAEHLIGRLYRCNTCKASVKNWVEPDSKRPQQIRGKETSTG